MTYNTDDGSIAIRVWKQGGVDTGAVVEAVNMLAKAHDDGETPFDVDWFTDHVVVSANNVEPGYGRPVAT